MKIVDKMKLDDGKEIVFRTPTIKDSANVCAFYNKVIKETQFLSRITPVTLKEEKKWVESMGKKVKKKDAVYIGAFFSGKLIGSTSVERKSEQTQKHVGFFGICILQEFTGKGIGKKLMELAEKNARGMKIEIMFLSVYGQNNIAQGLYRKMGFNEIGKMSNGIKHGSEYDDDILMCKVLK